MDKGIFYSFADLYLRQFATFEDSYTEDSKEISVSCKFTFSYNFVQNSVCCTNSICVTKEENMLIKSDLDAYFTINPDSVAELSDGDAVVLPPELQAQFASLAYGTMRGVIFTKTLGSPLNKIILPPNDVMEVLKTPLRFSRV